MTLSALLEDEGFVVDVCGTCAEARRLVASSVPYVAALLDLGLPDGSGADVVPHLREWQPGARVVVLSGAGGGVLYGADAFVAKGAGIEAILCAMRTGN